MKFKTGDCILADTKIREVTGLISGIIVSIRNDTLDAYRITWINKSFEAWSSASWIDKNYSKVSKDVASKHSDETT